MLSHFNSRFHQLRRVCQEVRTRVPPAAARHPAASHVEGRQGQDSVVFAQSSGCAVYSGIAPRGGEMNTVLLS